MLNSNDLAKLCGVSQGTVDRALHNRSGISDKTKAKVLKIAEEHGYQPNPVANELIRGKSQIVGAILPSLNSSFFGDLIEEVNQALNKFEMKIFLSTAKDKDSFIKLLKEFEIRRFCAAVVIPPIENIDLKTIDTSQLPVITFINSCQGKNTLHMAPNEEQTGQDAVTYLMTKGHRNILHLTYGESTSPLRLRSTGYQKQMLKNKLKPHILFNNLIESNLISTVKKNNITAIFCHNDWLALTTTRFLNNSGFKVPEHISILGVDNGPSFTELQTDITTLEYPLKKLGKEAAKIISNKKSFKTKSLVLPNMKIIDRSTVRSL